MPQMSPMWWTTIFMVSISTLLFLVMTMYFIYNNKMQETKNFNNKNHYWKW
uniref:ATP synthase complex subunit 8 n=1 Tax=Drabescoides nuchalis TaxID=1725375 RepID=A0A0U2KU11_9HEMI|nr:ATP synthase F0 subunit 8 [Drabescoides nuchalis]ALF99733.1 ATP synthase F0 subunit 8 [Drabescoides nuchalis]